jgi:hypothetical protein
MPSDLRLAPEPWAWYLALRSTDPSSVLGRRVKQALEQLRDDPGAAKADSRRYPRANLWALPLAGPDEARWLILWRLERGVIWVPYIGLAPGEQETSAPLYSSETSGTPGPSRR